MPRKFTRKQQAAAAMLARGCTKAEIRIQLKLRRTTLSRWMRLPEFVAEVEQTMSDMREVTEKRLSLLFDSSVAAMRNELNSAQSNPNRIRAAIHVLKLLGMKQILPDTGLILRHSALITADTVPKMTDNDQ